MSTSCLCRIAAVLVAALTVITSDAHAQEIVRVRVESPYLQSVLARASDKSLTLRRLTDRIEASNVIVYITCEHFRSLMLRGQTTLMSASGEVRYIGVQVDCMLPAVDLAAIVGHELRHVNEIPAATAVRDDRSFRRLFESIGFATCRSWASEHFETTDAVEAGERVRQEYLGRASQVARRFEYVNLVR